jgi:putative endonuclease
MLRCSDDSFYIGSTSYDDVEKRVIEHNDGRYIGYTTSRRPVVLVWSRHFDVLHDAHDTERRIKGWSRAKKLSLIAKDEETLVALSSRRAGKPEGLAPWRSKRERASEMQAIGALKAGPKVTHARRSIDRTAEQAEASKDKLHLIPAAFRHPEVRAKRAPKDD